LVSERVKYAPSMKMGVNEQCLSLGSPEVACQPSIRGRIAPRRDSERAGPYTGQQVSRPGGIPGSPAQALRAFGVPFLQISTSTRSADQTVTTSVSTLAVLNSVPSRNIANRIRLSRCATVTMAIL
jgi:hypothetical protein